MTLGKGLSRLVAGELRKSARLKLLERNPDQGCCLINSIDDTIWDLAAGEGECFFMKPSGQRIAPLEAWEAGEVRICTVEQATVFDG